MTRYRPVALAVAIAIGAALPIQPKVHAAMNTQHGTPAKAQPGHPTEAQPDHTAEAQPDHPYLGMWVTADGRVRHNLLPNGRYDEARGDRESAYRGRYEVRGNHIDYWDDTGFTADGVFIDDVLHHGGMVLHRRK